MSKTPASKAKLLLLSLLALPLLVACNQPEPISEPNQVIKNFQQNVSDINSGDLAFNVRMRGVDDDGDLNFSADVDIEFDRVDDANKTANIDAKLKGDMSAAGRDLDGEVDFNLRTIGDDFYVMLNSLDSSDPSLQNAMPFIETFSNKWLHIASEFVPADIRELQKADAETLEKEEKLRKLFAESNMIEVNKEYGIESINGVEAYHFGFTLEPNGVRQYLREAAEIDGRIITNEEVEDGAAIADAIQNGELWIGTEDFLPYKAVLNLNGKAVDRGVEIAIDLEFEGKDYGKRLTISAPADAEPFNPFQAGPGLFAPVPPAPPTPAE